MLLYGRGDASKVKLFFSSTPIHSNSYIFPQSARTSSLKTWTSTKSLLSFCGWWPKWVFSRCYIPLPKWAGTDSQATAVPTAGTEACQPITRHTGGQDSFWVSSGTGCHNFKEAFLLVKKHQIFIVVGGQKQGISYPDIMLTSLPPWEMFWHFHIKGKGREFLRQKKNLK